MSVDAREVGRRLGADLVIAGSVRKAGSRLRITAKANETESGHYVWSETFARKFKDVFAIQEEIAQAVGGLLRLHMPETRPRVHVSDGNLEAYIKYVKARVLIYQHLLKRCELRCGSYANSLKYSLITLPPIAALLRRTAISPFLALFPAVPCIPR